MLINKEMQIRRNHIASYISFLPNPLFEFYKLSSMDRISELHDSLVQNILKRLPLTDAVRTSVLSSTWKFRWTKRSALVVDESFYSSICKAAKLLPSAYRDILNSLLLQHSGSIESFTLFIPDDNLPNEAFFHHPIQFVLRTGSKNLSILKNGSTFFPLPRAIFSSEQLTELYLKKCQLDPPSSFRGLPNLIRLTILSVCTTADKISSFVSGCPQLQILALGQLHFPNDHLSIHAPKLYNLAIGGVFKSLSLRSAQNIKFLYILQTLNKLVWPASNLMSNFFLGMTKLQEATIGFRFNKLLATNGALLSVPKFQQLWKLTFHEVHLYDAGDFLCVSRLLENAPELKELIISLKGPQLQAAPGFDSDIEEFFKDCCCDRLQTVSFSNISGTKLELKLVEILLGCARVPEKMCVTLVKTVETVDKLSVMMRMLSSHT